MNGGGQGQFGDGGSSFVGAERQGVCSVVDVEHVEISWLMVVEIEGGGDGKGHRKAEVGVKPPNLVPVWVRFAVAPVGFFLGFSS